jgi:hypothetical protein
MRKSNCWEFKGCGRQLQGSKTGELGVCPASSDTRLDGVHDGINGGRACWAVAGTLCDGKMQGTFAVKEENCMHCDFYKAVLAEEGSNFTITSELLKKLR